MKTTLFYNILCLNSLKSDIMNCNILNIYSLINNNNIQCSNIKDKFNNVITLLLYNS